MEEHKGKIFIDEYAGYVTLDNWFEDEKSYKFQALFNAKNSKELSDYLCFQNVKFIYEEKGINADVTYDNREGGIMQNNGCAYLYLTLHKNK